MCFPPNGITFPSRWDRLAGSIWHRTTLVEFGEWRCPSAVSTPDSDVSSLNCVYLLASVVETCPSSERQSVNGLMIFLPPEPQIHKLPCCSSAAWVWWHVVVPAGSAKKAPVMKNLPAVLGIHLPFHTQQNLWALQHSASLLSCWDISEDKKERWNGASEWWRQSENTAKICVKCAVTLWSTWSNALQIRRKAIQYLHEETDQNVWVTHSKKYLKVIF